MYKYCNVSNKRMHCLNSLLRYDNVLKTSQQKLCMGNLSSVHSVGIYIPVYGQKSLLLEPLASL